MPRLIAYESWYQAEIDAHTDWRGFRQLAIALVQHDVPPQSVVWCVKGRSQVDMFSAECAVDSVNLSSEASSTRDVILHHGAQDASEVKPVRISKSLRRQFQSALLHSDESRLTLLYRLLWRLQREPTLKHDALDDDMQALYRLCKAVGRDMHKMKAFVRFRPVQMTDALLSEKWKGGPEDGEMAVQEETAPETDSFTWHVAWFEPMHHIEEAMAGFFMRRFANMHWSILTPKTCLHWNQCSLQVTDGVDASQAPAPDAAEQLWLAYYASTFNPARLKLQTMQKEMPKKYWKNLPEAQLIHSLHAHAHVRL